MDFFEKVWRDFRLVQDMPDSSVMHDKSSVK